MKKAVSVTTALTFAMSLTSTAYAAEAETEAKAEGYIPAPYTVEEGADGPTEYLEPVFYENEDGPTIGVTMVGVINEDGKYFKDSNKMMVCWIHMKTGDWTQRHVWQTWYLR